MNLLTEYKLRKNIEYLPPIPDSFCFFKNNENEVLIILCNYKPRTLSTCNQCKDNNFSIEITSLSKDKESITVHFHFHCNENSNLIEEVNKITKGNFSPIIINNNVDIETIIFEMISNKNCTQKEILNTIFSQKEKEIILKYTFTTIMNILTYKRTYLLKN